MNEDIREALRLVEQRVELEVGHRRNILQMHGLKAIGAGIFILLFGFNRSVEAFVGVWTRGLAGWAAVAAGVVLLVAARARAETPTVLRSQLRALVVIGAWDALMAIAVVAAVVEYGGPWEMTAFWHASPPPPQPIPFPMVIYVALSAFLWVHSRTIVGVLRSKP